MLGHKNSDTFVFVSNNLINHSVCTWPNSLLQYCKKSKVSIFQNSVPSLSFVAFTVLTMSSAIFIAKVFVEKGGKVFFCCVMSYNYVSIVYLPFFPHKKKCDFTCLRTYKSWHKAECLFSSITHCICQCFKKSINAVFSINLVCFMLVTGFRLNIPKYCNSSETNIHAAIKSCALLHLVLETCVMVTVSKFLQSLILPSH